MNYIGKSKGVLTVIEDIGIINKRHMVKVICAKCNNESIVRTDRIVGNHYTPKSCTHCVNELQGEISRKRYNTSELGHFRKRRNSILGNAKTRGIEVCITDEDIKSLISKPCYYCGKEKSDGIDRLDSTKGYIHNNCVPCCSICNKMKNHFSLDTFLNHIDKIYMNHIYNKSSTTISKESTSQANGDGSGGPLKEEDDIV